MSSPSSHQRGAFLFVEVKEKVSRCSLVTVQCSFFAAHPLVLLKSYSLVTHPPHPFGRLKERPQKDRTPSWHLVL